MKKKCAVCGYRFKDKDEVICPECLTAREDDISCSRYSDDLHSHAYEYEKREFESDNPENDIFEEFENKEESFIEEQREDEAENPIPSSTYDKKAYRESQRQQRRAAARKKHNSALLNRFQNGYGGNPNARHTTSFNRQSVNLNYNTTNRIRKNSLSLLTVVIVLIVVFAVIIISAVISVRESNRDAYNYDYDYDFYFDYDYSFPDISMPDMSEYFEHSYTDPDYGFEITASGLAVIGHYNTLSEYDTENVNQYVDFSDTLLADSQWNLVSANIELTPDFADSSRYIDGGYVICTSILGEELCTSAFIEYDDKYQSVTFLMPDDAWTCDIVLNTSNDSNEEQQAHIEIESYYFTDSFDNDETSES